MKKYILLLSFLIGGVIASSAQDFSLFEKKEYKKGDLTLPYRILYPENMKKGEKYPLFVFLHGMGMRGDDNQKQLQRGASLFVDAQNRKDYPCIAFYPQAPITSAFIYLNMGENKKAHGGWQNFDPRNPTHSVEISPYGEAAYDVIRQLIASGAVDTDRIYISGSSMGGFSTYAFIAAYPDLFAAAAPICGGTSLSQVDKWGGKVPVWIFHGDADPTVSVENSRLVAEKLKKMGAEYRYSEYPGVKHPSWEKAFKEPDYLKWFFSHSKKNK